MIARCDRCDAGRRFAIGYRWEPRIAPLVRHRCPECNGKLRAKRQGEHEATILGARPVPR